MSLFNCGSQRWTGRLTQKHAFLFDDDATAVSVSFHKVSRQSKRVQLPSALAQKTRKTNSSCTTQLEKCSAPSRTSVAATSFKRSSPSSENCFKLSRKLSERHQTAFHQKLVFFFTPAKSSCSLPNPTQQLNGLQLMWKLVNKQAPTLKLYPQNKRLLNDIKGKQSDPVICKYGQFIVMKKQKKISFSV